jgi:hypothetical protein
VKPRRLAAVDDDILDESEGHDIAVEVGILHDTQGFKDDGF